MQVAKWCARYTITTFTSAPRKFSFGPATQTATPIPIEAMFLLDPVTKDFSVNGIGVPSNVKKCYVMYHDQTIVPFSPPFNLSDWKSDLDVTLAIGAHFDPDRYARKFMENAVVCPEKGNNVTKFMVGFYDGSFGVRVHRKTIRNASHGAIGGLPWPERKLDIGASRDAADALNSWLKFEGLPIKVSVADFSAETLKKYKPMSDAEIAAKQVEIEQRERLRIQQIHREMLDAGPKY